jgi:hypothetical protein
MNKIELIGLIREIVKDEFKELLKSREGRAYIREIVGKETRVEVDKLLTEMEQSQGEVIQEPQQDVKLAKMVERGELPPKKRIVEEKKEIPKVAFTKNPKLNAFLQSTFEDIASGRAQLPSQTGAEGQAALLKEQYAGEDWKTMTGGTFTSDQARTFGMTRPQPNTESTGKPVAAMLPSVDVNGNPLVVRPDALPDHVQTALTKDYRKFMKKVDKAIESKKG